MTNEANTICEMLIKKFAETGSMSKAYDFVFGDGAYEKLAGELYDAMRPV